MSVCSYPDNNQNNSSRFTFFEFDPDKSFEDLLEDDSAPLEFKDVCDLCEDHMLCRKCPQCLRSVCEYCLSLGFQRDSRRMCSQKCVDDYFESQNPFANDHQITSFQGLPTNEIELDCGEKTTPCKSSFQTFVDGIVCEDKCGECYASASCVECKFCHSQLCRVCMNEGEYNNGHYYCSKSCLAMELTK